MIGKVIGFGILLFSEVQAEEPAAFRFSREIEFQTQAQSALMAVPLDSAVYAATAEDFRDVRLIDETNTEIPYWLQKIAGTKTVTKRLPVRSSKPWLEKQGEDGIVVTLELEPDEVANVDGMTVITPLRDFEYELQVFGSEDGRNWQPLVDKAMIYDYSRFMTVGNRDIELPGNNYKYFKISVAKAIDTQQSALVELTRSLDGRQEMQREEKLDLHNRPLHIERIELWHEETETVAENEQRFDYPLADFKVSRDDRQKLSLIDIDARLLPLKGFELKVATPNFNRHALVQIPAQQGLETQMSTIAEGNIEALNFRDIKREQTQLYFPEQRRQQYRVAIQDNDNPPLKIDGVAGLGPGYQLLFLAEPRQTYRLLYGAEKAELPQYDTAPIHELLRRGYQATNAGLGSEKANAEIKDTFDMIKLLNSNAFLVFVISLMVLVLGWSLYRVSKRVGNAGRFTK
ncbi:hypothetical protein [Methylomonas sp. MgM2]